MLYYYVVIKLVKSIKSRIKEFYWGFSGNILIVIYMYCRIYNNFKLKIFIILINIIIKKINSYGILDKYLCIVMLYK